MELPSVSFATTEILKLIRNYFDNEGFFEFETPMLHPIPGGANAKPFLTYHNSLDMKSVLINAPYGEVNGYSCLAILFILTVGLFFLIRPLLNRKLA